MAEAVAKQRIDTWVEAGDVSTLLDLDMLDLIHLPEIPTTVELLTCSHNKLTSLPSLDKYVNLKRFWCSHNQLTSLPSLDKCINLETLWCSDNHITSLPSLDKCVNLKEIWCSYNQLTSLPSLDKCVNLECLWCGSNQLRSLPLLPQSLMILQSEIQSFNIYIGDIRSYTPLTDDETAACIAAAITAGEMCPILYEPLQSDSCSVTPCRHVFSSVGLAEWRLRKHGSECPMCRSRI